MSDFSMTRWRKSSRSGSNGGQCVEVAMQSKVVGVRDSKDVDGPILAFEQRTFTDFLRFLRGR